MSISLSPIYPTYPTSYPTSFVTKTVLDELRSTTSKLNPLVISDSPIYPYPGYYTQPIYNTNILPDNLNLNNNTELQEKESKHFHKETLDEWLYYDLISLLSYLTHSGGKIDLIKDLGSYKKDAVKNDSQDIVDKKVDFIGKFFLSRDNMKKVLTKVVRETQINWYDLRKNESTVRHFVKKYLRRKFEKAIRYMHK